MEQGRRVDVVARCMAPTVAGLALFALLPPSPVAALTVPGSVATREDAWTWLWVLALAMVVAGVVALGVRLMAERRVTVRAED